jgi:hypothetical protein
MCDDRNGFSLSPQISSNFHQIQVKMCVSPLEHEHGRRRMRGVVVRARARPRAAPWGPRPYFALSVERPGPTAFALSSPPRAPFRPPFAGARSSTSRPASAATRSAPSSGELARRWLPKTGPRRRTGRRVGPGLVVEKRKTAGPAGRLPPGLPPRNPASIFDSILMMRVVGARGGNARRRRARRGAKRGPEANLLCRPPCTPPDFGPPARCRARVQSPRRPRSILD